MTSRMGRWTRGARRHAATCVTCAMIAPALAAQLPTVDGAAQARAAWRRAAQSQRAGLPDSAWRDVQRAADAFAVQPAYEEGRARYAALRGDTVTLVRSLNRLARLEAGEAITRDTGVRALAARHRTVARTLRRLEAALAPPAPRGRVFAESRDTVFFPEGLDVDASTGRVYVAGVRSRQVAVLASGQLTPLIAPEQVVAPVLGVRVDAVRNVLWVATGNVPLARRLGTADTMRAELLRVRLRDGVIEQRWRLGDGTGVPGELTVAASGDVFVTDAAKACVYRLRSGQESLEVTTHALVRSPQGIVVRDDGTVAWIADWSHGLLRWDLATGDVRRVTEPVGRTLVGIDGLRAYRGRLIGVQNGIAPSRIVDITLTADGTRAVAMRTIDRERPYPGDITVGTIIGDRFVFVASSQWPFFDDDGARVGARPLPGVVLREVRLRR